MFRREDSMYELLVNFLRDTKKCNVVVSKLKITLNFGVLEFDVVGLRSNDIYIIEAKRVFSKKLFTQAITRLLFGNYIYIAVPTDTAYRINCRYGNFLRKHGIGLLSISKEGCMELVRPRYNKESYKILLEVLSSEN